MSLHLDHYYPTVRRRVRRTLNLAGKSGEAPAREQTSDAAVKAGPSGACTSTEGGPLPRGPAFIPASESNRPWGGARSKT